MALGIATGKGLADIPSGTFVDVQPMANLNSVNSFECCMTVSADGTELFFTSNRPGGGGFDIFRATRESADDEFSLPTRYEALNTNAEDWDPFLADDGLRLFFASNGRGGRGSYDIYSATRGSLDEPFGNVVNLGFPVNTSSDDSAPDVTSDGLTMVFQRTESGQENLYQATRSSVDLPFDNVRPIDSINTDANERAPSMSADGRVMFFHRDMGSEVGIWVATRDNVEEAFSEPISIEELGIEWNGRDLGGAPRLSRNWPADGSKLYFSRSITETDADLFEATWQIVPSAPGDVNGDRTVDVADVDELAAAIRKGDLSSRFDVNADGLVDSNDHHAWVKDIRKTWFGDATLNAIFDSQDLVTVLQVGEYEDALAMNSTGATGDWDGDAEFSSADLVLAFQDGGYEMGLRPTLSVVPEPQGILVAVIGMTAVFIPRRVSR